jgi:hypothetical protein
MTASKRSQKKNMTSYNQFTLDRPLNQEKFSLFNAGQYTTEKVDGIPYRVLNDKDSDKAAMLLDEMNGFIYWIIRQLKEERQSGQQFGAMTYFVDNLINKYNPSRLSEGPYIRVGEPGSKGEPLPSGEPADTSYVINKGEKMVICLRDANGELHDWSTLQFVVLHEISHIASIQEQHEAEFWENFKWLLTFVYKRGMYKPVNYRVANIKYCGSLTIDSNPFYDPEIHMRAPVPDYR